MRKFYSVLSFFLLFIISFTACSPTGNTPPPNSDGESANAVIAIIDGLPSEEQITLDSENAVAYARGQFDRLTATAKQMVTNYSTLQSAEARIAALKLEQEIINDANRVRTLIASLPNEITLTREGEVIAARSAYDLLSPEAKLLVDNLSVLTLAEEKIAQLKIEETSYYVTLFPNGGDIDGEEKHTVNAAKSTVFINYYSTGYFSVYQSEVVLLKSSLRGTNTYTSAYKIGFNLTQEKYVIAQLIEGGTAFTDENAICDYYLLVHTSNATTYASLQSAKLGDEITINVSLPDTHTTSLGATLNVLAPSEERAYYSFKYNGAQTLPTPERQYYLFQGWFADRQGTGTAVTSVSGECALYAKWTYDTSADPSAVLSCVSDVATSSTVDTLITAANDVSYRWTSSNPGLYQINGATARVSKLAQTHRTQEVTVTAEGTRGDGSTFSVFKKITVNPITFAPMPDTPVATYFQVGGVNTYKTKNQRYLQNGTLFSDSTRETLDILYWAFANIDANGNVYLGDASALAEAMALKTSDTRIILCIAGTSGEDSKNFAALTADDGKRATFVTNLMNVCEQYNFDGIDIDWESSYGAYVVADGMNALMRDLRAEMNERQAKDGTPFLLSAAIPATSWGMASDRFDFATLNRYVDYINMMSYDLHNTAKATHLTALYSSSNDNGYGFSCNYGVEKFTQAGLDRNKIIIGSASYGKAYRLTDGGSGTYPALGQAATIEAISGICSSSGSVLGYTLYGLVQSSSYQKYVERNGNNQIVGSYLWNPTEKIFITYDSAEVIAAKYDYASSMKGVGIMCWAYTTDTHDVAINAMYGAMTA